MVMVALTGCGAIGLDGGGSGGGSGAAPADALDAIYLQPGATEATLAWPASEGPVESYVVFESRNGSPFAYSAMSSTPSVTITGQPGDTVQITVTALSDRGEMSEGSPPSAPLVFRAAEAAAATRVAAAGGSAPQPVEVPDTEALADAAADRPDATTDPAAEALANETPANESDTIERRLVFDLRALLLGGDARLPDAGLSDEARRWLQARVDEEIAAGVSLAGLGHAGEDALREVVWQDQSGQIFVSDGQRFLEAEDLPATFREAVRLGATERFVGLSDFDGDGLGDWVLEDSATGAVWLVDALGDEHRALAPTTPDDRLAGHGDFDGDGRAELLWWTADARLAISRPGANGAPPLADGLTPDGFELLAIADLDGNGRDDLLGRDADGRLLMAMSEAGGPDVLLGWRTGAETGQRPLDLLGTLDVDDDGRAEIAWLDGDTLEIWSAEDGLRDRLAL